MWCRPYRGQAWDTDQTSLPVEASRQTTRSYPPFQPTVYSRPATTRGEVQPSPTLADQATFAAGQRPPDHPEDSADTPVRCAPRQWGQSAAGIWPLSAASNASREMTSPFASFDC